MEFEEAARQSGLIPPERLAPLVSSLKKAPDFSWVLTAPHPTQSRLQGDLVGEIPVAVVDPSGQAKCNPFTVVVLNNTCDLQPGRSNFVTVAPVMDFASFSEFEIRRRGRERAENYLQDVKANKVFEILWLPAVGAFKAGTLVFLDRVGAVASGLYESALNENRRVASFSQSGFYFLLIKVTRYLARPESEEVVRQN
jgi:hypothetical protein